jgi:hypothetical protein
VLTRLGGYNRGVQGKEIGLLGQFADYRKNFPILLAREERFSIASNVMREELRISPMPDMVASTDSLPDSASFFTSSDMAAVLRAFCSTCLMEPSISATSLAVVVESAIRLLTLSPISLSAAASPEGYDWCDLFA